ncbi:hypothetical protein H8356DRAFT_1419628 [Neocallimastix lanati (nom. inval.)]|nr:hypothetical protein H8356DRAFT_1419628 [Neocallimastix sp. JGI-2020a]
MKKGITHYHLFIELERSYRDLAWLILELYLLNQAYLMILINAYSDDYCNSISISLTLIVRLAILIMAIEHDIYLLILMVAIYLRSLNSSSTIQLILEFKYYSITITSAINYIMTSSRRNIMCVYPEYYPPG